MVKQSRKVHGIQAANKRRKTNQGKKFKYRAKVIKILSAQTIGWLIFLMKKLRMGKVLIYLDAGTANVPKRFKVPLVYFILLQNPVKKLKVK